MVKCCSSATSTFTLTWAGGAQGAARPECEDQPSYALVFWWAALRAPHILGAEAYPVVPACLRRVALRAPHALGTQAYTGSTL